MRNGVQMNLYRVADAYGVVGYPICRTRGEINVSV